MSNKSDMEIINWAALPHCPKNQLKKAHENDAGWDIKAAKTVLVKPFSELKYTWEDVEVKEVLESEIPELFQPDNYDLFLTSIRNKNKFLIGFQLENKSEVIKVLNTLGSVSISPYPEDLENEVMREDLLLVETDSMSYRELENELAPTSIIDFVEKVTVTQRKKVKPLLIPTGIKVAPETLKWMAATLRSSMSKYGVTMPHSVGVIDFDYRGEVFISLVSQQNHATILRRGERIAQLIPMEQSKIHLNLVEENMLSETERGTGGFGSTGKGLKVA